LVDVRYRPEADAHPQEQIGQELRRPIREQMLSVRLASSRQRKTRQTEGEQCERAGFGN
jgi:hypothetical protein